MKTHLTRFGFAFISAVLLSVLSFASPSASLAAVTVTVTGLDHTATPASTEDLGAFHWTLQENVMFHVTPGVTPDPDVDNVPTGDFPGPGDIDINGNGILEPNILAGGFHKSHLPVIASGFFEGTTPTSGAGICEPVPVETSPGSGEFETAKCPNPAEVINYFQGLNPEAHYFLSVVPTTGYNIGGTMIKPTDLDVNVHVNIYPIPTAQINILVFNDNHPTNGAPDTPVELGLEGYSVQLEEAGGKYGASAGFVVADAFGNLLGTTYQRDPVTGAPLLDADGAPIVDVLGPDNDGVLKTDADGKLLIKNLVPAKYGIVVTPTPEGQAEGWIQTGTIEGTKLIDAWVLANEPVFFTEFGPPGPHVFVGFKQPTTPENTDLVALATEIGGDVVTINGFVENIHTSRQPDPEFFSTEAFGHDNCWVGLNLGAEGESVFAAPCTDNSFSIPGVPAGAYQLVIWSAFKDTIIAYRDIIVGTAAPAPPAPQAGNYCPFGTGPCELGPVGVFNWFARFEQSIFFDTDQDGYRDPGEPGAGADQFVTVLRFRDGTVYQEFPVDGAGEAPYDTVFPFFSWLVGEVGFGTGKATGATFTVDAGGEVLAGELLNPQPQFVDGNPLTPLINPNTLNNLSRTETGEVLTQGFQGFLGMTNVAEWGKAAYADGENGGISGIVFYGVTRAENDPVNAAGEPWEPGIPRVQVNLYEDGVNLFNLAVCRLPGLPSSLPLCSSGIPEHLINSELPFGVGLGVIKDLNGIPGIQKPDVDNYPLANTFGFGDVDANDNGILEVTEDMSPFGNTFPGPEDIDRNVAGVFDLGDAKEATWTDSWDDSLPTGCTKDSSNEGAGFELNGVTLDCYDGLRNFNQMRPAVFDGGYAFGGIDAGHYIVETVTPPGYELMKEEDQNVAFGAEFIPALAAFTQPCVGDLHEVPLKTTMFPTEDAPFAGDQMPNSGDERPLCDLKKVQLHDKQNAAADFWLLTQAPIAAMGKGFILNDLANEFDPRSPQFGEKFAPPFMPIAVRDWNGVEISRFYSDEFGNYNMPVPSTLTANVGIPSGFSPGMFFTCMNDAGPIPNPANPTGPMIIDPQHNKQYSQFCYPLQFMPGSTTYLDTPVVPVAAFTGPDQFQLDCECEDEFPAIASVHGEGLGGVNDQGPWGTPGSSIVITSQGIVNVPNPDYLGSESTVPDQQIPRDYGFGTAGTVTLTQGALTFTLATTWNNDEVTAAIPAGMPEGEYQLMVTRGDNGNTTKVGVTFTVRSTDTGIVTVASDGSGTYTTIQAAIDDVTSELIIVKPGIYTQNLIMHRPVKLQCSGAGSTIINVPSLVGNRRVQWLRDIEIKYGGLFDLLGEQEILRAADGIEAGLGTEAGAGILVLADRDNPDDVGKDYRIDGCSVLGADHAGGIAVNAFARNMNISNNRISNNYGVLGGGIRFGNPTQTAADPRDFAALRIANFFTANGGLSTRFRTAQPHSFVAGDQITISGYNPLNSGYNDVFVIAGLGTNPRDFIVDISFCGTGTNANKRNFCGRGNARFGQDTVVLNDVPGNAGPLNHADAMNDDAHIHHNMITQNGSSSFAGGGVALYKGSHSYQVNDNFICGNFTQGHGAGVAHLGKNNGLNRIVDNTIVFNQSFNQGQTRHGGGIFVGGQPSLIVGELSEGTGDVLIDSNLIQGNQAGSGDGAGIRLDTVNGTDIGRNRRGSNRVDVFNNMIVNNVAGERAGGISLQDSSEVRITHNTIANNDSTATATLNNWDFTLNRSAPQPAGIVSNVHTAGFNGVVNPTDRPNRSFSNPRSFFNNIIWHNRSFFAMLVDGANPGDPQQLELSPNIGNGDAPVYDDFGVFGYVGPANAGRLRPTRSLLTQREADIVNSNATNKFGEDGFSPAFMSDYFNVGRTPGVLIPEATTNIVIQAAFDEGGNFIDMIYGPLSLTRTDPTLNPLLDPGSDYHINTTSDAVNIGRGIPAILSWDIDDDPRSLNFLEPDAGADEAIGVLTAVPDLYILERDLGPTLIVGAPGVLANDTGGIPPYGAAMAGPMEVIFVGVPPVPTLVSFGTFSSMQDGSFSWTPPSDFIGTITFPYLLFDSRADGAAGEVTITVIPATVPAVVVGPLSITPVDKPRGRRSGRRR